MLRGKPVGVVQDSGKRSVIIASSKEAKKLGIGTGASIWEAKKICPHIIIVPAHFDRYIYYSRRFRRICQSFSDRVEVFSIDELFIDLTDTAHLFGDPEQIAHQIKDRLRTEVGCWFTCSIGIAPNKMLAKLASGSQKPDGLVVVREKNILAFLDQFKLWHICGIGKRIERRLNQKGIFTIRQLRQVPVSILSQEFGIMGQVYSLWAHGEDPALVVDCQKVPPEKSFGHQLTLPADITRKQEVEAVMLWLSWQVAGRMREKGMGGKTVSLSLHGHYLDSKKDEWFHRQYSPGKICATAPDIYEMAKTIYARSGWKGSVRFMGISVSNLCLTGNTPLSLFGDEAKKERLAKGVDQIARKYGQFHLRPAALLNKNLKDSVFNGFTKRF